MTMQVVLDGRELGQVATNAGWWDFAAWAATLPARFAEVRRLADRGMTPRAGALHAQLVDAIAAHPTPAGVDDVVDGLLSLLPEDGPGVFLVGDGVGDDVPIDEEIPVVHANPKGCNQFTGPGCSVGGKGPTSPFLIKKQGKSSKIPGVKVVSPNRPQSPGEAGHVSPTDPMAGHPFRGMTKQQMADSLAADIGRAMKGASLPRDGYNLSWPVGYDRQAMTGSVTKAIRSAGTGSGYRTSEDIYKTVREAHPSLTVAEFQAVLGNLEREGKIRGTGWPRSVDDHPHPEFLLQRSSKLLYSFAVGEGVGNANPKGCNQYSGPGCATYPTLKRTPGGAHELPSRDSPGVKRVTSQELTAFHGAVLTDVPGPVHEVAGKLGWDPHQTGHVLRRAMAEGLVSGRVAELLTGHPREQEYTYKNAEGELIGRVVRKVTHNVDALGYEIEEGGDD